MENLAPPYRFALHLQQDLESGRSVRTSVRRFVEMFDGEFVDQLSLWERSRESGEHRDWDKQKIRMSLHRRSLFELLDFSLRGVSVLEPLRALEKEMRDFLEQQVEQHLGQLPFKLLIPLLLFQFPALLLLILGPLLLSLVREVQ